MYIYMDIMYMYIHVFIYMFIYNTSKVFKQRKQILKNTEVLNRLEINGENNSFIILKYHKENFNNNPTVRLINPVKKRIEAY